MFYFCLYAHLREKLSIQDALSWSSRRMRMADLNLSLSPVISLASKGKEFEMLKEVAIFSTVPRLHSKPLAVVETGAGESLSILVFFKGTLRPFLLSTMLMAA